MFRTSPILLLAALGAGLAAPAAAEPNRGLDSVNQPVVHRHDFVLDLAAQGDRLAAAERSRLYSWFRSLGVGYGDRVFVDEAHGPTGRRQDVARVAADYGLLLSEGAPVTPGGLDPEEVRVIVTRSTASVPGCPNWERTSGAGATSSNYGCAVNSNLAAMVADPSDLVLGQAGSGTGDASTAAKAIKVYREAKPTGVDGLLDFESRRRK